jgi:predicted GIY-YIG superfamily endonuclease
MVSDNKPVTVRFKDPKNKQKLVYIAEAEDRTVSKEAERALKRHIKDWEKEHGPIRIE